MSHQLAECPSCRRTFIADVGTNGSHRAGGCSVCGTALICLGEQEAEVQDRLYGRHLLTESVTRVSVPAEK